MEQSEQRTVAVDAEVEAKGRTLYGFAALYNVESRDLGGFREVIQPGAFADVLTGEPDVYLTRNHDPNAVLARTTSGTLRLRDEERGLAFEADLGTGPTAEDVREAVGRGDITGASFRFSVEPDGESWEGERRTLTRIASLIDLSLATTPAYDGPTVELRSAPEPSETETETREEPDEMETETETTEGGLAVEDRNAADATPTTEQRILDAIRTVSKGERRDLTTVTAASITPPELSNFLFDKLRAASIALASGIVVIPTERTAVTWPQLVSDVDPTWLEGELDEIPPDEPGFDTLVATPQKLAHLVSPISNEVIDDSEPSAVEVLNQHLVTMLGLKLDRSIFEGEGGSAPGIVGLRNVVGKQTVSMGNDGAALTDYDPIIEAVGKLRDSNVPGPYAVAAHGSVLTMLELLKEGTESSKQLGAPAALPPFYTSSQLSITETQGNASNSRSVYVYAPGQIVLVRREDARVELDRSRLFNSDASEMRGVLRADLLVPNPAAVCVVEGVIPATP